MPKRSKDPTASTDSPSRNVTEKSVFISDVTSMKGARNKIPLVLLNFKHAPADPDSIMENNPSVKLDMEGWNANQKKPDFSLTLKTPHLPFVNTDDKQDTYYTTYLAIRDKHTGKSRLIETVNVLMAPKVEAPASTNPLLLKKVAETISSEERFESNKLLIKAFGQRKGQRYYENKEALRVDEEDAEAKVLKAAGAVDAKSLSTLVTKTELDIIPARDPNAGRADMIYRTEHILSEREVSDLVEACTAVLEQYNSPAALEKGIADRTFSPLGVYFLKKLLDQEGDLDYRAALTLYLDSIVKFTKLRPADLSKGNNALPKHLPFMIKKKIFDQFSSGTRQQRIISPLLKDKAMCYIIVLSLMLNNQKIETSAITESVRVDPKNLKKLVMMTGANLENDAVTSQQKIVLRKTLATYDVNYVAKQKKNQNR